MGLLTIIFISLALAMDSFAVSVACGVIHKRVLIREFTLTALFMGTFQAAMTIIGYYLGIGFRQYIEQWDHWAAFLILGFLGIKMIVESFKEEEQRLFCPSKISVMTTLAFATSIDALAVGLSFALLMDNPFAPATIIGIVAFILSYVGIFLGANFSLNRKIPFEMIGGIALIIIGIKILVEHIWF
jgi:manganese efflux pump family protein